MPFRIDNVIVLFGLFALAIPIVLHLLQRRRHVTLDWGAMQFLPDSIVTQRRRWLDEILLMLLRMAVIALIVLALATPISTSAWLRFGDRSTRDIVLVIDGSYSMDVRVPGQRTPWDDAVGWMHEHIDQAPTSDRFSILVARQAPTFVREEFAREFDPIAIKPTGNPDMPRALAEAWRHLQTRSKASAKQIVVITDGQRHGWADGATLSALDNLGNQWREDHERAKSEGSAVPSLRIVTVGGALPKTMPNYALAPLTASRSVAKVGQKITFRAALRIDGFEKYQPPKKLAVRIGETETEPLALPDYIDLKKGQIPLVFQHRFDKPGQHVISLTAEADDALQGDNEQQIVVDIVKELPILCVDGAERVSPESSSFFVQRALSAVTVPFVDLRPGDLVKPALVVLADVPRLDATQIDALDRFVADGGGLLIVAGERAAKAKTFYNEQLYQQSKGWMPVKLNAFTAAKAGVQLETRSFQHPTLELFRAGEGGLKDVRFPSWTKVQIAPTDRATVLATFSNGEPFLIEKSHEKGRVILCTVPLDRSGNATFPSTWEFPVLLHELAYYLAGGRSIAAPRAPDLRESDLTRSSTDDWRKVRDRLPIAWHDDSSPTIGDEASNRQDLWWLLMIAVIGLLCAEVWMTRRMARDRG